MDDRKIRKRNLICFPLGTVGRDMVYNLWTTYLMLYILYTRGLTNAQLATITGIFVAARVFDGLNDPIMGNIIERTRTKWGKFKPWLLIGIVSTSVVVYITFNNSLTGWSFVWLIGIMYFLYSITYTMHDIAYWGMVPALSSDADARNQFTSRATLFAGIGGTLASILIPLLTTGSSALGGSAKIAYGRIALVIALLSPLFICFTLGGVQERRDDMKDPPPPVSFKKIIQTIGGNDQLLWAAVIFLIREIGNDMVVSGVGSNYIYFEFGYEGGLYSTFTTIGMMATAFLMIFYPMISRRLNRKKLLNILLGISLAGYAMQIAAGLLMPATMLKFWIITIGFMLSNFGQYGFYLIMMISIMNTVEYNELRCGTRDEGIITSMRPFLTKVASALVVIIANGSYMLFHITDFTNRISAIEQAAEMGSLDAAEKSAQIGTILSGVSNSQTTGLLLVMTLVPLALMVSAVVLYQRFYKLDEAKYEEICKELEERKAAKEA